MSHRKFFITKQQLQRDYNDCLSTNELARKYGVSKKLIFKYMDNFGIERVSRTSPVEEVKRLASLCLSAKEIGIKLGYTSKAIRDIGRNYDIKFLRKYQKGINYKKKKYPSHPFADKNGNVLVHRLVMEAFLGRYLTNEEVVHHINGNIHDNRIENLELFRRQEEHRRNHMPDYILIQRTRRKSRIRGGFSQESGDNPSAR